MGSVAGVPGWEQILDLEHPESPHLPWQELFNSSQEEEEEEGERESIECSVAGWAGMDTVPPRDVPVSVGPAAPDPRGNGNSWELLAAPAPLCQPPQEFGAELGLSGAACSGSSSSPGAPGNCAGNHS